MAIFDLNQPANSLSEEDDVAASSSINTGFDSHVVSVSSSINTGCDSFASHDDIASYSNSLKTPKAVIHHEFIDTPGGSVYWVPRVFASVLPVVGTVYDSLDECIEMYRKYALEAGFGIRLSCQKQLKYGYVKQKVCGCKACVVFDMVAHTSKYTLTTFDVKHNHVLDRVEYEHLSKAKRKLTYNEQLFIIKAANANIGAVRAHNLYTGLKGWSSLVHGTQTEFKNFTCGVNFFIGDSDAQMLIIRMEQRQEFTKDFSFDYFIEDAELYGLFWADEVTKCHYKEFGDVVSFDATYKTNKYRWFLCLFTAIGQSPRYVLLVVSGLLKKCNSGSLWMGYLEPFQESFVRPPNLVVTDQIGAMHLAVAAEFPESKHRLCMWHIMQKIPAKIVWNMFLLRAWRSLRTDGQALEEFNLVNHKWLSKMYRLRSSWVLAFFIDSPLCGLMRTTTRSESENSFFSYFTSSGSTPVEFMLCYESAMERQRHTQEKLDHQSFDSFPALLTPLPIEQHAAKVYTRILFIRVQKEIVTGSWLCSITCMSSDEGCTVCIIDEEKIKPVSLPEVIDKESTLENVEEEINLHQKVTGHYKKLDKVKVENPTCVRPKGREKQKRIKSRREISMKKSMRKTNKKKNGCGVCGSTDHNRRTCPQKNDVDVLYPAVVIPGGSDHVHGGLRDSPSAVVVLGGSDHVEGGLQGGASGSVSV
ncbi:RNA-directed DNA polymerase, eukaryota [Tanacetum coccineum]